MAAPARILYGAAALFWLGYYLPCALGLGWHRRELAGVLAAGTVSAALWIFTPRDGPLPLWAGMCLGLFLAAAALFLAVEWAVVRAMRPGPLREAPVVLVLGCRLRDGRPGTVLRQRLEAAEAYLRRYPESVAVLTGGGPAGETEAEAMAAWLREAGIPPRRLRTEPRADTTAENMAFSRLLCGDVPAVALVTSGFHMFRARLEARRAGLPPVIPVPAGNGPPGLLPYHMAREFLTWFSGVWERYRGPAGPQADR